jgi:hypothetical protein
VPHHLLKDQLSECGKSSDWGLPGPIIHSTDRAKHLETSKNGIRRVPFPKRYSAKVFVDANEYVLLRPAGPHSGTVIERIAIKFDQYLEAAQVP